MNENIAKPASTDKVIDGPPVRSYRVLNIRNKLIYQLLSVGLILFTLFTVYQTKVVVEAYGDKRKAPYLNAQIAQSKELRAEVAAACKSCPQLAEAVSPHEVMFTEEDRNLITRAAHELFADQNVVANFPDFDGLRLDQTKAVIIPLEKLEHEVDWDQMGLTPSGATCGKDDGLFAPKAVTIRERPVKDECLELMRPTNLSCPTTKNGTPRMTRDGTPRIAIPSSVVTARRFEELKYTLLHEFVHAHDVPAYSLPFTWAHNDLTYLSTYNEMLAKLGIRDGGAYVDLVLWLFAVLELCVTIRYAQLGFGRGPAMPESGERV